MKRKETGKIMNPQFSSRRGNERLGRRRAGLQKKKKKKKVVTTGFELGACLYDTWFRALCEN